MKTLIMISSFLLFVVSSCFSSTEWTIAKTLYAEARSEGLDGLLHVATVIYNRGQGNYNKSIKECLKPKQFSCWNNVTDIKVVELVGEFDPKNGWTDMSAWINCREIELLFKNNKFKPLGPWNHYALNNSKVKWFKLMRNKKIVGNHTFGVL